MGRTCPWEGYSVLPCAGTWGKRWLPGTIYYLECPGAGAGVLMCWWASSLDGELQNSASVHLRGVPSVFCLSGRLLWDQSVESDSGCFSIVASTQSMWYFACALKELDLSFPQPFGSLGCKPPLVFKAKHQGCGGIASWCSYLGLGCSVRDSNPLLLRGDLCVCDIPSHLRVTALSCRSWLDFLAPNYLSQCFLKKLPLVLDMLFS